jgi:transcriptional regulator with XRE-family HTH domain
MERTAWFDGAELRDRRLSKGMSQLTLAAKGEVSQNHLSQIEHGRSQPSPEAAGRLAAAVGCEIADLKLAKPAVA